MCTPKMRSVLASANTLTVPLALPIANARPFAPKPEVPFLYSTPSGFELLFGFTHPSDFRIGVNHERYVVEVDMRFLTYNAFGNGNAFVAGFVCQHRAANHVADCPYVRQVGTAFAIYFDKAALVFFQAYGFRVQAFGVWNTADGNDQFVEYFGFGFASSSFVSNGNTFALQT